MVPLALTMGDPAGIGGELTLKAWLALRVSGLQFVALDDPERLVALSKDLQLDVPIRVVDAPRRDQAAFSESLPVLPVRLPARPKPGNPDPVNAEAVVRSISWAAEMAMRSDVGGVVTNPINKSALYRAGFNYPGHTEFLAALTNAEGKQIMMLASPMLRVVPVTVHASLKTSIDMLETGMIISAARATHHALKSDFGLHAPRLAMAGLNPHAGENGALGSDEAEIIEPALEVLRREGIDITGPWPPDTMFTHAARAKYDAAICMYHDQALIPLKALDMERGVNITLGLPIVRTSPDHGTAYDIAGTGAASPTSLIEAIKLAGDISLRRSEMMRTGVA